MTKGYSVRNTCSKSRADKILATALFSYRYFNTVSFGHCLLTL